MGTQAIKGPRQQIFLVDPDKLILVGKDTDDGPDHPLYDPRAFEEPDERMVANIRRAGVKKPILVRKVDDEIQVVDGRRRVINAREANIELKVDKQSLLKVPVKLEKGKDDELFETMVLTNFFSRRPSPVESAQLLQRYLEFEGKTEEDAAAIFGVTPRTISNWKVLLGLDNAVQKAVDAGQITGTAAAKLAPLTKSEQKEKIKELVAAAPNGKRVSVTAAAKGAGNASATQKAPSKKVIRKVLALDEDVIYNSGVDDEFLRGVQWAIGVLPSERVKGMTKLLRKAQDEA